jgi:hypothetical protein
MRAMAVTGTDRGWTRRCGWLIGLTKTAEAGNGEGRFDASRRVEWVSQLKGEIFAVDLLQMH